MPTVDLPIRTQRLVLRDFCPRDLPALVRVQTHPCLRDAPDWDDRDEAGVARFLDAALAEQRESPRVSYELAVTTHDGDGCLVGSCWVGLLRHRVRTAGIGYMIDPVRWGNGYATEVTRALLRAGFDQLGLHRIRGLCVVANAASARVMEKAGMRREARLVRTEHVRGQWHDEYQYALTREEWEQQAV